MQENTYHYPVMPEITITREGIVKLLKNLKTNKAAGPDALAPTKFKYYGIRNITLDWLKNVLNNRQKCVVVDEERPAPVPEL